MRIQYHNRHQIKDSSYSYVTLEELIKTSDVISLNLAVTPETHHMLSAPQFSAMKPGVVIINTARGALIDEKALVKAIEDGKVYAAGLDVFEEEPTINEELLKRDEVVLSPHLAAGTVETMVCVSLKYEAGG
jgi:glyoxylate reductase